MRLALTALFVALASASVAEIRVYQPPAQPAAPSVSRGITPAVSQPATPKVEQPKQPAAQPLIQGNAVMTNPLTGEMREATAMPRQLEIFLAAADLQALLPKLQELTNLPEFRKLNIKPDVYVDKTGVRGMMAMLSKMIPPIKGSTDPNKPPPKPANLPNWNIRVDNSGELAKSYGIQNQSTIVYRDQTGAVRLYNLNYEVEKLQRQLAREMQDAQPAR